MRRLIRCECPKSVQSALDSRQEKIDRGAPVRVEWDSFRGLKSYRTLRLTLGRSLGNRQRCAYCSDSLGADVEHFWPKEQYPGRAFVYHNLSLICAPCNRKKSSTFPVDTAGTPLLIDPAADDPWDALFFVENTGWIDARIKSLESGHPIYSEKGVTTLAILGDQINSEPVAMARLRSWKQIVARFRDLVSDSELPESLEGAFGDIDDYGLAEWLFNREGKEVQEIRDLRFAHPEGWRKLRELPRF